MLALESRAKAEVLKWQQGPRELLADERRCQRRAVRGDPIPTPQEQSCAEMVPLVLADTLPHIGKALSLLRITGPDATILAVRQKGQLP